MKTYSYRIELEPAEEGGFVVTVPTLGLATQGDTYEEAIEMAKDVIRGHLQLLREAGEPIPTEPETKLIALGVKVEIPAAA